MGEKVQEGFAGGEERGEFLHPSRFTLEIDDKVAGGDDQARPEPGAIGQQFGFPGRAVDVPHNGDDDDDLTAGET